MKIHNTGFVVGSMQNRLARWRPCPQMYFVEMVDNDVEVYHMDKSVCYGRFYFDNKRNVYINGLHEGIPFFRVNLLV
jgi:hypothetical protein